MATWECFSGTGVTREWRWILISIFSDFKNVCVEFYLHSSTHFHGVMVVARRNFVLNNRRNLEYFLEQCFSCCSGVQRNFLRIENIWWAVNKAVFPQECGPNTGEALIPTKGRSIHLGELVIVFASNFRVPDYSFRCFGPLSSYSSTSLGRQCLCLDSLRVCNVLTWWGDCFEPRGD